MPATTTRKAPPSVGGRPTKADAERRCKQTNTRWTIAEDRFLREQASAAGVTVGEFIRRRALLLPVTPPPTRTDARLVHELNSIGVNLNQISRNLNADRVGVPGSRAVDLDELMNQLHRTLDQVVDAFLD